MWKAMTENGVQVYAGRIVDGKVATAAAVSVAVCETQPIAVAGIRALLGDADGLDLAWAADSLPIALQLARTSAPNVLVLDKGFGVHPILDALADIRANNTSSALVVWGTSVSQSEALRFLQSGARGILRKTSDLSTLVSCIHRVAAGGTWMEEYVVSENARNGHNSRSALTPREQQVLALVEQGMRNKEIAAMLDIRPGTVKIHLKHIFEKTGVHGRYGLALATLTHRGRA
jgi:DNA-binding NarL/FixJ family response regulator